MEKARGKERRETGALWRERLDDSRLVKVIMKMQDCGSVSWQDEYDQLLRKYGLEGSETGSAMEWKERVHELEKLQRLGGSRRE